MTKQERLEIENQIRELQDKLTDDIKGECEVEIENKRKLLRKCYKYYDAAIDTTHYEKVVSEYTTAIQGMSVLSFSLPVKVSIGQYFNDSFCSTVREEYLYDIFCEPFAIIDESIEEFEDYEEISLEEYNKAMDECYRQFKEVTNNIKIEL